MQRNKLQYLATIFDEWHVATNVFYLINKSERSVFVVDQCIQWTMDADGQNFASGKIHFIESNEANFNCENLCRTSYICMWVCRNRCICAWHCAWHERIFPIPIFQYYLVEVAPSACSALSKCRAKHITSWPVVLTPSHFDTCWNAQHKHVVLVSVCVKCAKLLWWEKSFSLIWKSFVAYAPHKVSHLHNWNPNVGMVCRTYVCVSSTDCARIFFLISSPGRVRMCRPRWLILDNWNFWQSTKRQILL